MRFGVTEVEYRQSIRGRGREDSDTVPTHRWYSEVFVDTRTLPLVVANTSRGYSCFDEKRQFRDRFLLI